MPLVRRSAWSEAPQSHELTDSQAVVVGDSLGEMAFYFGAARVCLLGGSFEPLGGQNLIEACACSCPVVMGPHTFNFKQAADWALKAKAGVRVLDMAEAVRVAHALALNPAGQTSMAAAALAFTQSHQGAVAQSVALLKDLVKV
jgi:3-deoxy-D-manno-octulosonic-acid transferase